MAESEKAPTTTVSNVNPKRHGTIHIIISKVRNAGVYDYGHNPKPYVLIRLLASNKLETKGKCRILPSDHLYGTTDPIVKPSQRQYIWPEHSNNEIDIPYDPSMGDIHLQGELWNDNFPDCRSNDELIGLGKINATECIEGTKNFTITLNEGGTYNGEIDITVSFDPPLRKAYLVVSRLSCLLDLRDAVIRRICGIFMLLFAKPIGCVSKYRKAFIALLLSAIIPLLGGLATLSVLFIPIAFISLITLPLWIVPAIIGGFITAPVWIPLVLFILLTFAMVLGIASFLVLTSRQVRKCLYYRLSQIKKSQFGRRVLYESCH